MMNTKKVNKSKFPVEVLRDDMLPFIMQYLPYLDELLGDEIKFNNLKKDFIYHYTNTPINTVASIDKLLNGYNQITFYDNYLQYLWCLSYSFIVFYDQLYKKSKTGEIDKFEFGKGLQVFENGLSLLNQYETEKFYSLPNPTESDTEHEYISKASSIFLNSFSFILCHEFGHQYLGHLTYDNISSEQSKSEELNADDFAISIFIDSIKQGSEWTKKCGMITALSSLVFLDNTLKGGDHHPDPDDRIKKCLVKLNLSQDDPLWGWASLFFIFWSYYYHSPIENNGKFDNAFLDFEYIYEVCQNRKYE